MRALFLTAVLMSGGVAAAEPQYVIDGSDVDAVVEIARNYGSATVERQASGQPKLAGRIDGINYAIYFQNCAQQSVCDDINLYAGFLDSKPTQDRINTWNKTKQFGRAYIDPDGDAALEMDINLKNGVTAANLSSGFAIWRLMLEQFTTYIGIKR